VRKGEVVLAVLGPSVQWAGFDHGVGQLCPVPPTPPRGGGVRCKLTSTMSDTTRSPLWLY